MQTGYARLYSPCWSLLLWHPLKFSTTWHRDAGLVRPRPQNSELFRGTEKEFCNDDCIRINTFCQKLKLFLNRLKFKHFTLFKLGMYLIVYLIDKYIKKKGFIIKMFKCQKERCLLLVRIANRNKNLQRLKY